MPAPSSHPASDQLADLLVLAASASPQAIVDADACPRCGGSVEVDPVSDYGEASQVHRGLVACQQDGADDNCDWAAAAETDDPIPPSEMDDFDLAEAAEASVFIPGLLDEIRRRAALLTADELLSVEPFEGDDSDVRVLSSKAVRGRQEHRDHWSGMPIPAGELHVVRKEVMDGEFLTTRHSRETLWMSWAGGFDASALAKQVTA